MSNNQPKFKVCRRLGPGVYDKCQTQKFAVNQSRRKEATGKTPKKKYFRLRKATSGKTKTSFYLRIKRKTNA